MKPLIKYFLLAGLFHLVPDHATAVRHNGDTILLYVERSRDKDIIVYSANLNEAGNLISENPINIYWLRRAQNNQTEPLTLVQKKYGYGLQFLESSQQSIVFSFISFSNKTFELRKDETGVFRVFTHCGNREMMVNSLFVHFNNDSFWFPKIGRVDLHATDISTRSLVVERLNP
jgi:hypothetical protein